MVETFFGSPFIYLTCERSGCGTSVAVLRSAVL